MPSLSNFAFDRRQSTVFELTSLGDQYFGSQHAYSSYTMSLMSLLGAGPGGDNDLDIETRLPSHTAHCCDCRRSYLENLRVLQSRLHRVPALDRRQSLEDILYSVVVSKCGERCSHRSQLAEGRQVDGDTLMSKIDSRRSRFTWFR